MENREDLVFHLSDEGKKTKYEEAMKILEYSVLMVEIFEIKEFNNVIAGQLRLLLCDTSWNRKEQRVIDNSLIKKINPNPKLYPVKDLVEVTNKTGDTYATIAVA